ncbi:MAG: pitrilysin family protein [Flavobacteriaceae bacterium]|nr:pitrilysin family protein [Flavobacteriaceae bacterium]
MKTKIISLIILFLLSISVTAQIDRSQQPKSGPAPKINLGKPQTFELKNGLKVLVVENHKLPRVSASLTIDNPPIFEGEKAGTTSLTGSLLGSGSKKLSKNAFNEEVDYLGARIFFSSQGAGLNSLTRYFPRVLELMADAALNPVFTQEEFDKERNKLLDGIKSNEKSVAAIAGRVQNVVTYGKNHAYGEFVSQETANKVSLEDVTNFYNTYYKPNNAYLVIVGDVNFKEVKKLVTKHFNNWGKGNVATANLPEVSNVAKTEINFVDMPNAVQSEVAAINTLQLKMGDPDYHAVLLANQILGGDFNSYLNMNLREAHGYTYGARSRVNDDKYIGSFKASTSVRNMVTDSTVVEIIKEIKKIRTENVTEEALKNVKAGYVGKFVMALEQPATIARYALNIKVNNLPENFYETYLEKINAVTIEDIKRVAQKYFNIDNARIVIAGKAVDVIPNLEKAGYKINYFDIYGNPTTKPELSKPIPAGVTINTVFDNYFKAIGGKDKTNTVKSTLSISEASLQGMTLEMTTKQMASNKYTTSMSMMGNIMSQQVFDGEKGYVAQMGQKKPLEGELLEKMKTSSFPFAENGYLNKATLLKIEPIDGKDAYVIKIGNDTTVFYDVVSGLKTGESITQKAPNGQEMTQTVKYQDYKEVAGVKFPHTIKMTMGPQQIDFKVKELKVNEGVTATDFQ